MGIPTGVRVRRLFVLASGYLAICASSALAQYPVYPFSPYPAIPPNVSDVDGTDMRLYFRGRTTPTQTMQGDFHFTDYNNVHFATVRVSYGPLSNTWSASLIWLRSDYSSGQPIFRNLSFSPNFPWQGQPSVSPTASIHQVAIVRGVGFELGVEALYEYYPGVYVTETVVRQESTYQDMGVDEYRIWHPGTPEPLPPVLSNPPYK